MMMMMMYVCAADSAKTASREVDTYLAERNKYKERSEQQSKKGRGREAETLKMLAAFQSKMEKSRKLAEYVSAGVADDEDVDESKKEEGDNDDDDDDDDANNLGWLVNGLGFVFATKFVLFIYVSALKIGLSFHFMTLIFCFINLKLFLTAAYKGLLNAAS